LHRKNREREREKKETRKIKKTANKNKTAAPIVTMLKKNYCSFLGIFQPPFIVVD